MFSLSSASVRSWSKDCWAFMVLTVLLREANLPSTFLTSPKIDGAAWGFMLIFIYSLKQNVTIQEG